MALSNRAGVFMNQPGGYRAFIPKPLPPDPPLKMDNDMLLLLSTADRCLGRLDGITQILPNPDLFVAMYVKKEAVLSSQIEGTQASLIDVLDADDSVDVEKEKSIEEIVNYIKAMNYGLTRLEELPLSLRLIKEIHKILLQDVRGGERSPGEFRKSQNWIGPAGCTLSSATFVPPPHHEAMKAMADLELFFHEYEDIPPLIKIGFIHAQFETIHPFLDGNGRIGRLLITFWLCQQKILRKPLLYLSHFFKMNRTEYYDRLMDIRLKGDWENWIKFFLKGIAQVSIEATETAKKILKMKEEHSKLINSRIKNPSNGLKLLENLFEHPVVTINKVADMLEVTYPTANALVSQFCDLGILHYNPKVQRNRKFRYSAYIDLLQAGTELTT
ncbi:MAG: Fic family protein [Thermoanaerobacteraceae bacterium]|nr:Fic family protein [Thermoanaerobacteraceae bacterium]